MRQRTSTPVWPARDLGPPRGGKGLLWPCLLTRSLMPTKFAAVCPFILIDVRAPEYCSIRTTRRTYRRRQSAWRLYCTVAGLSWLGGNSSQISGGDRVSRLISILRPRSIEARADKNFTSHREDSSRHYTESCPQSDRSAMRDQGGGRTFGGKIDFPEARPPHVFADIKTNGRSYSV